MVYQEADASISICGRYRYWLKRVWDSSKPTAGFCLLNPSTAVGLVDGIPVDDPTIRRCAGFAKSWGCGGIRVVNLFAIRATDLQKIRSEGWSRAECPTPCPHEDGSSATAAAEG